MRLGEQMYADSKAVKAYSFNAYMYDTINYILCC